MAAAINTFIERFVLRKFFNQPVVGKRGFWLLFAGQSVNVQNDTLKRRAKALKLPSPLR